MSEQPQDRTEHAAEPGQAAHPGGDEGHSAQEQDSGSDDSGGSSGGQVSEAGSSFGGGETDLNGADAIPDKTTGPGASNQER